MSYKDGLKSGRCPSMFLSAKVHTWVELTLPYICMFTVWLTDRDKTIRINTILCIAFERIAVYCHVAMSDSVLVKDISYGNMGFSSTEKNIHPV